MTTITEGRSPTPGRRGVLRGGVAATAGLVALGSLEALGTRTAGAAPLRKYRASPDYGPLRPARDQTTGLELLHLPRGFRYLSYGWTGDMMANGAPTPPMHDGMAAFGEAGADNGIVRLVRNHEVDGFGGTFADTSYDPAAGGGTTNLTFDPAAGAFLDATPSLGGTIRNCAGGPTPWGSWLTCEETTVIGADGTRHGYVFEVPADGEGDARPLIGMGRFSHEAVAVDPTSHIVYLTEDEHPSGFYRYLPVNPDDIHAGGELQMLVIETSDGSSYETYTDPTGTEYDTAWVTIANPDPGPEETPCVLQGQALGAAVFARLEGAWWGNDRVYIVSTSGGPTGQGQVFEYDSATERMRVLFASPDAEILNNPDNLCVSPRGGIVLCEDGDGAEFLHGLTPDGEIFPFAKNALVIPDGFSGLSVPPGDYSGSELAGATFEPHGDWLFMNIQTPGVTFAITGPWKRGSL